MKRRNTKLKMKIYKFKEEKQEQVKNTNAIEPGEHYKVK